MNIYAEDSFEDEEMAYVQTKAGRGSIDRRKPTRKASYESNADVFSLFVRDVEQVCQYFARYGVVADAKELASDILSMIVETLTPKRVSRNCQHPFWNALLHDMVLPTVLIRSETINS